MLLRDLRAIFHRPMLTGVDAEEFHTRFLARSYNIATLVSVIGAIDGTILTMLALTGNAPQYAIANIYINIALSWSAPLLLLVLRKGSLKWYPWIICASIVLSNGQYVIHVLHDLLSEGGVFGSTTLRNAITHNAVLDAHDNASSQAHLQSTFLQLQLRVAILTFWVTALVQLPFTFAAALATGIFVLYTGMMYLTASPHEFFYAVVRLGFIVFLGIMVSATMERRERRLFLASKDSEKQLERYASAQAAALAQIQSLEAARKAEDNARAESMRAAFHDIRTPIAGFAVGINTYEKAKELENTAAASLAWQNMRDHCRAAGKLADDLFDMATHEARKADLPLSSIDVVSVLDDVVATFRPSALQKHIILRLEADRHGQLGCLSNESALRCVVTNLVSNAVKFTGMRPDHRSEVVVEAVGEGSSVFLRVRDTGIGISKARENEIWDYGKTTKGTNKERGHGMGLAMVRAICDSLPDHELRFESTEGEGSTFSLQMPKCDPPPMADGHQDPRPRTPASLTGRIILVVENDKATRDGEALLLELLGGTVLVTSSVSEALAKCDELEKAPDLLLTDFHLDDGETGSDVIVAVRAKFGKPIPTIIVTADQSTVPVEATRSFEHVVILKKGIDRDSLMTAIDQLYPV